MASDLALTAHLAGFFCGMVLYGLLFSMTVISWRRESGGGAGFVSAVQSRAQTSPVMLAVGISVLGLLWNTIALFYFASRDFRLAYPSPWLGATAYSALGFLPAVVVHSAVYTTTLRPRALVLLAYTASTVGALQQLRSAADGLVPSIAGLQLLTGAYALLLAALLVVYVRSRLPWRRSLSVVALAAFAVSALHLSRPESHAASLPVELIGHHASLPLVLVLLFQDYRFAFGDIFLKRALSFLVVVGLALLLHSVIIDGAAFGPPVVLHESLQDSVRHIAAWVLTALAYPSIRSGVNYVVDRFVLNRANYAQVRRDLERVLENCTTESGALQAVEASLAHAFDTQGAVFLELIERPAGDDGAFTRSRRDVWSIETTELPQYTLRIGELRGGRRILSDEERLIGATASMLARRIDAIRFAQERFERDLREEEVTRLATEAELRALRAQLNPHFLFNALTTIGYLIKASPDRALDTLYRLTHLLRAVLRRSSGSFVQLGDEIELVESYLAIERARFEERLTFTIDVPVELRDARIPPLTLQPLVENAIKHGIASRARGGTVSVAARLERDGTTASRSVSAPLDESQRLVLEVVNSRGSSTPSLEKHGEGVGLPNIAERLKRYYGSAAQLQLMTEGDSTVARIELPHTASEHELSHATR